MKRKTELHCQNCPGRSQSVFCELEGAVLEQLDSEKNANLYKKGQNLFIEGNPSFGLFCIHSGKVKLTKTDAKGNETIIRLLSSGDVLGHRSLFSNTAYSASATMIEDGLVCFVSKPTIYSLMDKDPKLSLQIINRLSHQMGTAEDRLASMARKSSREKLAETFLLLKEKYGASDETTGAIRLDIKLTREELAAITGAAPENVIRLIKDFKEEGLISQQGKTLFIEDVSGLEDAASLDPLF